MSTIVHINKQQVPGKCGADPSKPNYRGCPFSRHFNSVEEAQEYIAEQSAIAFGDEPLPNMPEEVYRIVDLIKEDARFIVYHNGSFPNPEWSESTHRAAVDSITRAIYRHEDDPVRKGQLQEFLSRLEQLDNYNSDEQGMIKAIAAGIMQDERERKQWGYFDTTAKQTAYTRAYLAYLNNSEDDVPMRGAIRPGMFDEYMDLHHIGPNEGKAIGLCLQTHHITPTYNEAITKAIFDYNPHTKYQSAHLGQPISAREQLDLEVERRTLEETCRNWIDVNAKHLPANHPIHNLKAALDTQERGSLSVQEADFLWHQLSQDRSVKTPFLGKHKDRGYRSNYKIRPSKQAYTDYIANTYGKRPVNGFVYIDTETSSLIPRDGDILEYGLVFMDTQGNVLGRRSFIQKPQANDGYTGMVNVHRIDRETASKGVNATEGAVALSTMLRDWVPVAHNADFDRSHVNEHLDRAGQYRTKGEWVDTMLMYHTTGAKRTNLKNMTEEYGVDLGDAHHSAIFDAMAGAKCFQAMLPTWDFGLTQKPNPKLPDSPFEPASNTRGDEIEAEASFFNKLFG